MEHAELKAWILSELRWFVASEATRRKKNPEKVVRLALLNRLIDQWEESPWVPVSYDVLAGIADAVHPIRGRTPENLASLLYQMRADLKKVLTPRGLRVDIRRIKIEKQSHGARVLSVSVHAKLARTGIPVWAKYEWFAKPGHPMGGIADRFLHVTATGLTRPGEEPSEMAPEPGPEERAETGIVPAVPAPEAGDREPAASHPASFDVEGVPVGFWQDIFIRLRNGIRKNPVEVFLPVLLIGVLATLILLIWRIAPVSRAA